MSAVAEAEFLAILSAEQLSKFCAIGAYTWLLYDNIIMLPTEIRYVWIKPWGISKALYLWMRCFGATFLTVYMSILFTPSHSERFCYYYFVWQGCGGSLILFTVEVVLQLRIFAMYNKNKTLATVNLVFFAMEIIAMMTIYNIGIRSGTTLATPAGITGCWGFTTKYLFSIWFPGLAFECWLAGLAVWKAVDRSRKGVMVNGQKVDLLALLIRDSVIYFLLIAAGLASNAFIWLTSTSVVVSIVVPIAHASMIVGGSRLFLNLREAYYVSIDTTTWQIATTGKGQRLPQFAQPSSNGLFHETMGELTGTFTVPDFGLTYVDSELDEVDTDTTTTHV